ncbi:ssk1 response regulator receiver [Aspergillus pseudoviridinutans]|uniref:Ssk1 response regulator receiver n=1 Tax=Aspergillus pseudoviridinutans TaxID=1517512 RepID=A0A9P3ETK5_9EURO|nr:ssk1 response regulator receiver [Aspergillus pseudoviridinutans]GIJ85762.1 ssk1 response regulator receiver [Aspergillus pseudoviridinutans]
MPERRLSQLLKSKLLRRSSTTATTYPKQNQKPVNFQKKAAAGADPPVDPNSASDLSCSLPPHLLTPNEGEGDAKSRAYSIVSSIPLDHLSTPGEIPGPATGSSAGCDQYFTHFDRSGANSHQEGSQNSSIQQSPTFVRSLRHKQPTEGKDKGESQSPEGGQEGEYGYERIRNDSDPQYSLTAELANKPSPPQTPVGDDSLHSASATPPPLSASLPRPAGASSRQAAYGPVRESSGVPPLESQLTPSLGAVAEDSSEESVSHFVGPPSSSPFPKRPTIGVRRQSLLPASHQHLISGLLGFGPSQNLGQSSGHPATVNADMIPRKIWVKRPGGSATLVPTMEDSLVDELRDQVIMKYANSLGKTFDSPDIMIRISPREGSNRQSTPERILSPEEPLGVIIDTYFPGGQTVDEALVIDIPQRRTPKPSPRHPVYYHHSEPGEHGEYFPLMPANPNVPTPPAHPSASSTSVNAHTAPSISILTTGMAPPLPSPGNRATRHSRRPPLTRHTTNSPTMLGTAPNAKDSSMASGPQPPAAAPQVPTPPGPPPESPQTKTHTPPARVASPRPRPTKPKKAGNGQSPNAAFGGLIEGTVPPINVLIVEDNIINQKLLEAFMKRLSVRWKCAANGEEAVRKWRQGGFHLVLMDIQLPVMNGLDATKEIRRLERLNGVGVFTKTASGRSSASSVSAEVNQSSSEVSLSEEDTLHDLSLFKSPVIIVALTASSLQSDRHEALAAGCNDFLTKPVGFPWLEQKVTEWGCMQALIDFEGWRKWRGFADEAPSSSPTDGGLTSPLQTGANGVSSRTSTSSSSGAVNATARELDAGPGAGKRKSTVPELTKPVDILPGEPPGSGSGEGNETLDSPASPLTSVHVGDPTEPSNDEEHQALGAT